MTGPDKNASAVLIRAIEPVENIEGKTGGPALVCRAMNIDRKSSGRDLTKGELYIAAGAEQEEPEIAEKPRIGVDYAGSWAREPLRFFIKNNQFVSGKK